MKNPKTLNDYKLLPYTLHTEPSGDGHYWIAEYIELRGCKTDGETEAAAVANLQDLFDDYIQTFIEEGIDIPIPIQNQSPIVTPFWVELPSRSLSSTTAGMEVASAETSSELFQA